MIIESHLWETADGGLVPTGHPSAVLLKYPAGTHLSDDEAKAAGLKAESKPPNKALRKPKNKANTDGNSDAA